MKKIEQYDILTLEDDKDYSVLNIINKNDKTYYLIAEIDEEEDAILDTLRILEYNDDNTLSEILDNNLIEELKELFVKELSQ